MTIVKAADYYSVQCSAIFRAIMNQTQPQSIFMQEVCHLRAVYAKQRESTNLVSPAGRSVLELSIDVVDGIVYYTYWYNCDDGSPGARKEYQVVRLADIPSTRSGAILRLECNLPTLDSNLNYEIVGDEIWQLGQVPLPPPDDDDYDDAESINEVLATLPEVQVDPDKHFVKKSKYISEIRNLLKCQGGSCPGVPKSAHIIQLLGKSPNGELVFEKFIPRYILAALYSLSMYKTWILQIIDGLRCLHSLAIVHRDLRIENLVFTADTSRLLICDLESRWGNRLAPEISRQPNLNAGWTEKSDIYDLGYVIKGMIYGNAPITNLVEWHIPPPLDAIVASCTHVSPKERPSLDELFAMVSKIET